jgi:hypothetical protein
MFTPGAFFFDKYHAAALDRSLRANVKYGVG